MRAYPSGFYWKLHDGAGRREGPQWELFAPSGKVAATVFCHRDTRGHNWFVWDENGTGGENSVGPTIWEAKIASESAVLRWGKHFTANPPSEQEEEDE